MDIEKMMRTRNCRNYGAHSVKVDYYDKKKTIKGRIQFSYYGTPICEAFPHEKEFHVSDQGFDTVMTHKFISEYIKYFSNHGYRLTKIAVTGVFANKFSAVYKTPKNYNNCKYFILNNTFYKMVLNGKGVRTSLIESIVPLFELDEEDKALINLMGFDQMNLPLEVIDMLIKKYTH